MALIDRHRKIHEILKEELKEKIHALKINIKY
jgi:stress-induced morphogen